MNEVSRSKKRVVLTVLDSIMTAGVLLISIYVINSLLRKHMFDTSLFTILYFVMSIQRFVQIFVFRDKDKKGALSLLFTAVFYFISGMLILIFDFLEVVIYVLMILFFADLMVGRILAVLRSRRWVSRILNGILALLLMECTIAVKNVSLDDLGNIFVLMLAYFCVVSLLHVISMSFSQIKVNILMKIIRRTYALEILFGMMMLIATFSYVLMFVEDSVETYWDGLWYCFAIVTTIGFGDIAAVSIVGRLLSVILGIYGIIMVSLVTSIIINFYGEVKNDNEENDDKEKTDKREVDPSENVSENEEPENMDPKEKEKSEASRDTKGNGKRDKKRNSKR